ncbi:MAG: hypothetical protein SPJ13_00950 [Bacteroidales bacterium]|nr:hypothetical protein [Bacteroidales bacterium]
MEKNILLKGIVMMSVVVLGLAACSKEKDVSDKIAGNYNGYTAATFSYSPRAMYTADEKVVVKSVGPKTVSVTLTSQTWGTATFNTVQVTEGSTAALNGSGTIAMPTMGGQVTNYDASIAGTITLDRGSADLNVNVPAVMGGVNIAFKTGTMPDTSTASKGVISNK